MTSDYYAILGVNPAAEDVVIGAAYRALMRHYHPDTNSDPQAQARAQEITAAYTVLRDRTRRAEYDAARAADSELWPPEEEPRRPPPMRAVGIGSTLVAAALVAAVWLSPRSDVTHVESNVSAPAHRASPEPPAVLEPEPDRLTRLAGASPPAPPPAADSIAAEVAPAAVVGPELADPPRSAPPVSVPARKAPPATAVGPTPRPEHAVASDKAKPGAAPPTERITTLDRMSSGFFTQSWAHADAAKKAQLVAARDRSVTERRACRSDSCVADAYVREIRETSAIMEPGAAPAK